MEDAARRAEVQFGEIRELMALAEAKFGEFREFMASAEAKLGEIREFIDKAEANQVRNEESRRSIDDLKDLIRSLFVNRPTAQVVGNQTPPIAPIPFDLPNRRQDWATEQEFRTVAGGGNRSGNSRMQGTSTVELAAMYVQGRADSWLQGLYLQNRMGSWEDLAKEALIRFKNVHDADIVDEFNKLQQSDDLEPEAGAANDEAEALEDQGRIDLTEALSAGDNVPDVRIADAQKTGKKYEAKIGTGKIRLSDLAAKNVSEVIQKRRCKNCDKVEAILIGIADACGQRRLYRYECFAEWTISPYTNQSKPNSLWFSSAIAVLLALVFVIISIVMVITALFEGRTEPPKLIPEFDKQASFLDMFTAIPVIVTAFTFHFNVVDREGIEWAVAPA
ncbi:LOW QUALITY PROTEIN: hypothetical protein V2J09_012546 [Rumex salicifolius]